LQESFQKQETDFLTELSQVWEQLKLAVESRLQQKSKISQILAETEQNLSLFESCVNQLSGSDLEQHLQTYADKSFSDQTIFFKSESKPHLSRDLFYFQSDDFNANKSASILSVLESLQSDLKIRSTLTSELFSNPLNFKSHPLGESLQKAQQIAQIEFQASTERAHSESNLKEAISQANEELSSLLKLFQSNNEKQEFTIPIRNSGDKVACTQIPEDNLSESTNSEANSFQQLLLLNPSSGVLSEKAKSHLAQFTKRLNVFSGNGLLLPDSAALDPPVPVETINSSSGITLDNLIERLLDSRVHSAAISETFLRCYRYFMSTEELLEKLVLRYCSSPSISHENWSAHREKEALVRPRVIVLLKKWLSTFPEDFQPIQLYKLLESFLLGPVAALKPEFSKQLLRLLESNCKNVPNNTSCGEPEFTPVHRKFSRNTQIRYSLLTLEPAEFAQQLTLYEHNLFAQLTCQELLHQRFSKNDYPTPNILRLSSHFNQIPGWLWKEILSYHDVETRAEAIRRTILISLHLYQLKNFNGLMEFLAALNSTCITRLRKTWQLIEPGLIQAADDLCAFTFKNYSVFRRELQIRSPPLIPFIGMFLTDLTFLEDGNPNFVDGKINFGNKFTRISDAINLLLKPQNYTYQFSVEETFWEWLSTNIDGLSDTESFELSEVREPREELKKYPKREVVKFWVKPNGEELPVEEIISHIESVANKWSTEPSTDEHSDDQKIWTAIKEKGSEKRLIIRSLVGSAKAAKFDTDLSM
jgi:hypothetical protein